MNAQDVPVIFATFSCNISFIGDYIQQYIRRTGTRPVVLSTICKFFSQRKIRGSGICPDSGKAKGQSKVEKEEAAEMGKTLEEYAAQHPRQEPEQERQAIAGTVRSYLDRQQERETVEQLKVSITRQLQEGNAPQYILYAALRAIGILTHDEEWAEAGKQTLDSVYEDLAQQSLLTDNAVIAAERLDTMKAQYNDKLRRQLQTQLNGYRRIERALQEALQAVNALEPQDPGILK